MIRPVRALCISLAVLASSLPAAAQIAQPTYVRPSKGEPLTVMSNVLVTAVGTASAVYEWKAFQSMTVEVSYGPTPCTHVPILSVHGGGTAAEAALGNVLGAAEPSGIHRAIGDLDGFDSYTVNVTAPYIRIVKSSEAWDGAGNACTVQWVRITPVPFVQPQYPAEAPARSLVPIASSGVVAVSNAAAVVVSNYMQTGRRVLVQNRSIAVVCCGFTSTVTCAAAPILLSAGSADVDGTGGSFTLDQFNGPIWCRAATAGAGYAVGYVVW